MGARSRYGVREPEDADGAALELGVAVDAPEPEQHERAPSSSRTGWGGRRTPCAVRRAVPVAGVDEEAAALGVGEQLDAGRPRRRASSSQRSSPVAQWSSSSPLATFA